jgi:maltose O-acetyltransferase
VNLMLARLRGEQYIPSLRARGLAVGDRTYIGSRTRFDPGFLWAITIGSGVVMAHDTLVIAHDASMRREIGYTLAQPVTICDGAYIGAACVILPGVTIGERAIVGAGSLVREDVAPETVVAGNPARPIAARAEFIERHRGRMTTARRFDVGPVAKAAASDADLAQMRAALASGPVYVK